MSIVSPSFDIMFLTERHLNPNWPNEENPTPFTDFGIGITYVASGFKGYCILCSPLGISEPTIFENDTIDARTTFIGLSQTRAFVVYAISGTVYGRLLSIDGITITDISDRVQLFVDPIGTFGKYSGVRLSDTTLAIMGIDALALTIAIDVTGDIITLGNELLLNSSPPSYNHGNIVLLSSNTVFCVIGGADLSAIGFLIDVTGIVSTVLFFDDCSSSPSTNRIEAVALDPFTVFLYYDTLTTTNDIYYSLLTGFVTDFIFSGGGLVATDVNTAQLTDSVYNFTFSVTNGTGVLIDSFGLNFVTVDIDNDVVLQATVNPSYLTFTSLTVTEDTIVILLLSGLGEIVCSTANYLNQLITFNDENTLIAPQAFYQPNIGLLII